jgi:hypothetical protein
MCLLVRKKYEKNIFFASLKSLKKGVGFGCRAVSRSISQGYGSADLDPQKNVTDAQHTKMYPKKKK